MRFIIKPDDSELNTLLETVRYQNVWRKNSRKILKALRETTKLEFQQRVITARVFKSGPGKFTNAGGYRYPMELEADSGSEDEKLFTLIHELSHRLIGGNALRPVDVLSGDYSKKPGKRAEILKDQMDHRHLYLFEYDLHRKYFGEEFADKYAAFTVRGAAGHSHAWEWAMSMPYEQRQRAVQLLGAKALTRDRWGEYDKRRKVSPDTWYRRLNPYADPRLKTRSSKRRTEKQNLKYQ